jgi:NTE family protein
MNKAALVLSGGGALGVAHMGALRELEKNYQFDYYAGISAGAIVAGLAACGMKAERMIEIILEELKLFSLAFDFSSNNYGIIRAKKIKKLLDNLFEERRFEDLDHPLVIAATDFTTGKRVLIKKGRIADAVRASLSVPVLFDPYYHPELKSWLVDGGLTGNLPLKEAQEEYSGLKIIAINLVKIDQGIDFASSKEYFRKLKNLRKTLERTIKIMLLNQLQNLEIDSRTELITPELQNYTTLDIFKFEEIIEVGAKSVNDKKQN